VANCGREASGVKKARARSTVWPLSRNDAPRTGWVFLVLAFYKTLATSSCGLREVVAGPHAKLKVLFFSPIFLPNSRCEDGASPNSDVLEAFRRIAAHG
jgi:hypothetical protein